MSNIFKILIVAGLCMPVTLHAQETMSVGKTRHSPLLDGTCSADEWSDATKLTLSDGVSLLLMQNDRAFFVCAKGKPDDYTVLDIYIKRPQVDTMHNLHASAQLSESRFNGKEWGEPNRWNLVDWGGFWVPYAGQTDYEEGKRPKFLKGSDREIVILKRKFAASKWLMMFGVSGIHQDGEYGGDVSFPEKGRNTDASTWLTVDLSN